MPSRCKQCVAAPEQCGKNSRCPNASTRKSGNHSPDGNSALTPDLKYLLPPDSDRAHAAPARACLTALSDNAQGRTSARADSQSAISERTAGTLVRRAARSRLRGSESSVRPPANSRATPRCRGSTPDDLIPQNSTRHCPCRRNNADGRPNRGRGPRTKDSRNAGSALPAASGACPGGRPAPTAGRRA